MTLDIPPEKMAEYRAGARRREAARRARLDARFEQTWAVARECADVLRRQFQYDSLASRLEQVLIDLAHVTQRIETQLQKATTTDDDAYLDAVALNLHGFYAGIEHAFEDVAQTVEQSLPAGSRWRQNLLLQMSAEIPGKRPSLISRQTRDCLDEYRQFRHVVRNVYTFNLRGSRLQELAAEVGACFTAVSTDLSRFIEFLRQLNANDNP